MFAPWSESQTTRRVRKDERGDIIWGGRRARALFNDAVVRLSPTRKLKNEREKNEDVVDEYLLRPDVVSRHHIEEPGAIAIALGGCSEY